ncbi:hypothetical protein F444_15874 [Phytophthora nicotianae P1976]|uniref:Uncharacterized protein n=1 Tax=Phytophthora nicotianae P1976 TaxID=1317066 RepID=A0A080ZKG3_PHYNI|nr:hypothetical protein F444_15874 [Phytophthora nicotianae P1976]
MMDIEEFVCNPSEQQIEMETISPEALLDESSDVLFVWTSSGESHEPDKGIEDNTEQPAYETRTLNR